MHVLCELMYEMGDGNQMVLGSIEAVRAEAWAQKDGKTYILRPEGPLDITALLAGTEPKFRIVMVTTEERGWAGHFIMADRCHFRRNTLVTHRDRRIVVSTVGGMLNRDGQPETVGSGRYYETMAFEAEKDSDGYWDADVSHEVGIHGKTAVTEWEAQSDREANDMHNAAVAEIANRLACEHAPTEKDPS